MNKRNVYLINLSFGLAGMERRFANIWRELRRRGNVCPTLVVPESLGRLLYEAGLAERGDPNLWPVAETSFACRLGQIKLPTSADKLKAFLRSRLVARGFRSAWRRIEQDPDAIVHIGLKCSALVPPDVPLVYECVDSTLTQLGREHYVRAASRRCIVHCQTERIRDALERCHSHRMPLWKTVTSPCYFASYPDMTNNRKSPAQPMLIAFVGRLTSVKNPLLLLDAMACVRRNELDCRVLILGKGPMLSDVKKRINELNLNDVVEVSFTQRPLERLQEASIFVSLQSGDNYGSQSLLEAMGVGCAVVATDVGETYRLVTPDVGLLVKAEPQDVANALSSLIRDPVRTTRMGCAGSALVRKQYSADSYIEFLESLYSRAYKIHNQSFEKGE